MQGESNCSEGLCTNRESIVFISGDFIEVIILNVGTGSFSNTLQRAVVLCAMGLGGGDSGPTHK